MLGSYFPSLHGKKDTRRTSIGGFHWLTNTQCSRVAIFVHCDYMLIQPSPWLQASLQMYLQDIKVSECCFSPPWVKDHAQFGSVTFCSYLKICTSWIQHQIQDQLSYVLLSSSSAITTLLSDYNLTLSDLSIREWKKKAFILPQCVWKWCLVPLSSCKRWSSPLQTVETPF